MPGPYTAVGGKSGAADLPRILPDRNQDHEYNKHFKGHPKINPETQVRLLTITPSNLGDVQTFECTFDVVLVTDLPKLHYVALSYFWGEARSCADIHKITIHEQDYWIRTNLWTFFQGIRDFQIVSPIFIDAICLNQRDDRERGYQIKLLSEVYSHSNRTHVWLGCPNARQFEDLGALQHNLDAHNPLSSWNAQSSFGLSFVCSRNYWRRLWVVQELLLSKTVTIHCGKFAFPWAAIANLMKLPLLAEPFGVLSEIAWWEAWQFKQPVNYSEQLKQDEQILLGWQSALRLFYHRREWLSNSSRDAIHTVGLPFHRAMPAFQTQQCRDTKDKVFALIGLIDSEGKSMINTSYGNDLKTIFVDAAAAGLVSRWREDTTSRQNMIPSGADMAYFFMLNDTLGLETEDINTRIAWALDKAALYLSQPTPKKSDDSSHDQISKASRTVEFISAALFRAAERGDKSMVSKLLRRGADPEFESAAMSPLFVAAQKNHMEVVKELFQEKADIEFECGGATALYDAAEGNRYEMVKLLVRLGANPYARVGGVPAFIAARREGNHDIDRFLFSQYSVWNFQSWVIGWLHIILHQLTALVETGHW